MSTHTDSAYQIHQVVTAQVEHIFPFGAFVCLPDGARAYVRKRELTQAGDLDPRQVVSEGEKIKAVVIALVEPGRNLELSVRRAEPDPWDEFMQSAQVRDAVTAEVKRLSSRGAFVQVIPGVDGFIPLREMAPWPVEKPDDLLWVGDRVEAMITRLDWQARRMRLSIRQQMIHLVRVREIAGRLQADEAPPEPTLGSDADEPHVEDEEPVDLQALGRVLVLDDHKGIREELVVWLERHHCRSDGVGRLDEGLAQIKQVQYDLAVVDLDLAGQDGVVFIRSLQEINPDTKVIVMSIPEWIAERSHELEALQVVEVFAKPLDMDEVSEVLGRLAQGEAVGPFRVTALERSKERTDSFQPLARTMRNGTPLTARFGAGVEELVRLTQAELGLLFHLDPVSRQISIAARAGRLPVNRAAVYALAASPVKDLIIEGGVVFVPYLSDQARPRFKKLLDMVSFQSCLGVPVSAAGQVEYALFLFHRKPGAMNHYRLRDAQAMAMLLGVALESQALEERIEAISPFLLSGHLAAGFGHDVFNKMSAVELQVRNLKACCGALAAELAESCDRAEVSHGTDRLLETTLDLKQTVEAFRELIRDEGRTAVDVNQQVQRAVLLLQALARRHRVQIKTKLAPDLPLVAGSPVRLRQVFLNVMLNAVQHTAQKLERWSEDGARLQITTGLDPQAARPVWVRFDDSGPGIHLRLWKDIFALGFSTRPGGTGLGLFIARSLVESMGGTVCVEQSLIPSGATFRVELPAAALEA